jgi:hypothetical protein
MWPPFRPADGIKGIAAIVDIGCAFWAADRVAGV